jgi:(4S)-4-hydroxy-5-phosphonooxypentane-2,3-dione isomerase
MSEPGYRRISGVGYCVTSVTRRRTAKSHRAFADVGLQAIRVLVVQIKRLVPDRKQNDGSREREDHMAKLAIVATAEIPPGRMDEVLRRLMAHREWCLKNEPGTLQLEVLRPRDDDSKVLFYEVYSGDAAFKAHSEGPSVDRLLAEAKDVGIKLSVTLCSIQE